MKTENQIIKCPSCGTEINVSEQLSHQFEESVNAELLKKEKFLKEDFEEKQKALTTKEQALADLTANQESILKDRLEAEKKKIQKEAETKIKLKLETENFEILKSKDEELNAKSEQLKEFNKTISENARLKRDAEEMKGKLEAENEMKLNATLEAERKKITEKIESSNELKFKELEKQLEVQKNLTKEMQRKQDQGSMQLQGEVMELAIEDFLIQNFPLDTIEEIKKGASGADCLQTVHTFEAQNCGTIYYESKRTKIFQHAWIEKFRKDIQDKSADIGILVTEVLPAGMERMGFFHGIYICTFDEFKALSTILRQSLITINSAMKTQENKGDKMVMLYDFLISTEFRMQMEGIIDGFRQMEIDLISEKRAMAKSWKQREKQIQKVINNTVNMYGSIKGIGGNAVQTIPSLELGYDEKLIANILEDE